MGLAFELKGEIKPELLRKAFAHVWSACDLKNIRIDLAHACQARSEQSLLPEFSVLETQEGVSKALLTADFSAPFDLEKEAPLRLRLLQVKPEKCILSIVAHHVALDGWSLARMLEKACQVYNALHAGAPLPPMPWESYGSYAEQQRKQAWLESAPYWRSKKFFPPLFSADQRNTAGHRAIYILNRKFHGKIKELAKANRVTPFLLLMHCFMRAIGSVLKREEFVAAVPIAAREADRAEFVIGNCVNLMPMNIRVQKGANLPEELTALKEQYLDSIGHSAMPIQEIQRLHPQDLTQVHFNFEPVVEEPTLSGAEIDFYPFPISRVEKPLIINVNDTKNTYYIEIDYQFQFLSLVQVLTIFTESERAIQRLAASNTQKS